MSNASALPMSGQVGFYHTNYSESIPNLFKLSCISLSAIPNPVPRAACSSFDLSIGECEHTCYLSKGPQYSVPDPSTGCQIDLGRLSAVPGGRVDCRGAFWRDIRR